MENSEFRLIDRISLKIPRPYQGDLGIGDDADTLSFPHNKKIVASTDVIVENVDFTLRKASPEQIGHKALAVNLSDMAAMGAKPVAYLVTLGLPASFKTAWVEKLYAGMMPLTRKYELKCLGGDLSRSADVFVSVTVLGVPFGAKVVTRSQARPGDLIAVSGSLGGSIAGHHLSFEPRIEQGCFLAGHGVSAMMDISDGLVQDLGHLAKNSKVTALVDLAQVPVSAQAKMTGKSNAVLALNRALCDGEDFELLFTVPQKKAQSLEQAWKRLFPKIKFSWLGVVEKGRGAVKLFTSDPSISLNKVRAEGFSHFR